MLTEKGTLPVGVEFDGKIYRNFEIRPQLQRDTIDLFDDPETGERALKNMQFYGLCIVAGQIISIGDIPKEKITPDMVMEMWPEDFAEIQHADKRLKERMATFRGADKPSPHGHSGHAEAGLRTE